VPCGVWDRRGLEGRKKGDGGMGRSSCCRLEDCGRLGWMAAVGAGTRDLADGSIPSQFYHRWPAWALLYMHYYYRADCILLQHYSAWCLLLQWIFSL
jgi:hypothetical protein